MSSNLSSSLQIQKLHELLAPHLLRRLKADVLKVLVVLCSVLKVTDTWLCALLHLLTSDLCVSRTFPQRES